MRKRNKISTSITYDPSKRQIKRNMNSSKQIKEKKNLKVKEKEKNLPFEAI